MALGPEGRRKQPPSLMLLPSADPRKRGPTCDREGAVTSLWGPYEAVLVRSLQLAFPPSGVAV